MPRAVLALIPLPAETLEALASAYVLQYCPTGPDDAVLRRAAEAATAAVVTNGTTGLQASAMAQLPGLQLVCSFGVGYEGIDLAAARQHNIAVANAPDTNGETVADHALGFMLALSRGYAPLTRAAQAGAWATSRAARPTLHGSTLGIVGMGRVGQAIARRAAAFGMHRLYNNRSEKDALPYGFVSDVVDLARRSDFLVAACPGGAATHHLIDERVLTALGPAGYVVNVARGSVVHTAHLVAALEQKTIAGAGLDVLETEPQVPAALQVLDNVLITPHLAGRSPAAQLAQRDALMYSLSAFFAGLPLASEVLGRTPADTAA